MIRGPPDYNPLYSSEGSEVYQRQGRVPRQSVRGLSGLIGCGVARLARGARIWTGHTQNTSPTQAVSRQRHGFHPGLLDYPTHTRTMPLTRSLLLAVIALAGSGGQALMCSSTFLAVQHMTEELSCVTHDGARLQKLHNSKWMFGLMR